ncbi:MAG: prepilin-type N-terminal cleavage/methylation domain-containing protein [Candidatus Omnitrophota bacterium]
MRTSRVGKNRSRQGPAPACFRQGFTLIEIMVSLFILATGFIFLLVTVRRGLTLSEMSRTEFQSSLAGETMLSGLPYYGISPDSGTAWKSEEVMLRPGLKVILLSDEGRKPGTKLWVSRLEVEEPGQSLQEVGRDSP